ncbi:hypothetical protein [Parahaliea mediterranea]|uniref:hypothetical protein n=1 Tax=Parahaliea mediterranea TaxID=651086 RepID=UPI00130032CC|nr:hypothetical protein [Parahaliea mediterranea]
MGRSRRRHFENRARANAVRREAQSSAFDADATPAGDTAPTVRELAEAENVSHELAAQRIRYGQMAAERGLEVEWQAAIDAGLSIAAALKQLMPDVADTRETQRQQSSFRVAIRHLAAQPDGPDQIAQLLTSTLAEPAFPSSLMDALIVATNARFLREPNGPQRWKPLLVRVRHAVAALSMASNPAPDAPAPSPQTPNTQQPESAA